MAFKVRIGSDLPKSSSFDLSHDVNTTSDFGFCQPLMCREIPASSTMTVKTGSFVRAMPMPKPTFGRISYRIYHQFVKLGELWPAFESMLARQPFTYGGYTYIPASAPYVRLWDLKRILGHFGSITFWSTSDCSSADNGTAISYGDCVPIADSTTLSSCMLLYQDLITDNGTYSMNTLANYHQASLFEADDVNYSTPFSADLVFELYDEDSDVYYLACVRLSRLGRNLRKIFIGCGYQICNSTSTVSILPLFAYYKAYFDLFAPQRDVTWKESNAYLTICRTLYNYSASSYTYFMAYTSWTNFIIDLANCYYTSDPDFISSHISGVANYDSVPSYRVLNYAGSSVNVSALSSGSQIGLSGNTLDRVRFKAMDILSRFVNKNTVIGGKIDEFLRTHYGSDYVNRDDNTFIGVEINNVNVSDVIATAETEEGNLGEYAGKGTGFSDGEYLKYSSKVPGYWISLACIVPVSKFSQGIDPNVRHLTAFDFETPALDSLTLLPSYKSTLFGVDELYSSLSSSLADYDGGFGNIPNYSEYKFAMNVSNGDFSLPSTRGSLMPYHLDRLLPYNSFECDGVNLTDAVYTWYKQQYGNEWLAMYTSGITTYPKFLDQCDSIDSLKYYLTSPDNLAASTEWRYIGKNNWIGNYNRIFYNTGRERDFMDSEFDWFDDNFLVHNVMDVKLFAPMIPIASSFDTDGFDDNSITVDHE